MTKKICLYGIMSALCIVLGYVESLISFDFIAPGIKIGLSNSVALLLIARGDIKGAFAVNIVRILLSALLFSSPAVLIYSLSGGIASLAVMSLLSRITAFSVMGFSVAGAAVHNSAQLLCAFWLLGGGVLYYTPLLLFSAVLSGSFTGFLAKTIIKKMKL